MTPQISPCQSSDLEKLAKQLQFATQQLQAAIGVFEFNGTVDDLAWIQQGLDSGEIEHITDLQCLGVPFGQVIINSQPHFKWWMLEDDLGITPCIRYRQTDLVIFPLTLISKRIEQDEPVDVSALYTDLITRIAPLRQKLDSTLESPEIMTRH